ncbi:hypothetical protein Ae201684_007714 [Aphanomyces euteiches]|uniref:START domain-containing protein n=1 Tax=Aphanomyces euteiches TaxID=100861 RepID=A0A6G0X6S8_9STRA|nr:hypothetical protein Ae201684_007714 [Aphanomyces euteiches]KAH9151650.1 hypothetical protein AeRB84_005772 [Aphanomyces euteiches]
MWDELCLLLATDDSLNDELTAVCDILEGDSPDEASDTASLSELPFVPRPELTSSTSSTTSSTRQPRKPRTRPHFDVRQKQEMIVLRREVDILKKHLATSQSKGKRPLDMTKWEKAAKSECMEKNRSIQENEQLKEAVHQQATLIQQMEKLCNKKIRLSAADAEGWQNYRLAAHESLRVAAIHAIADRQYRRMQNAFIQAGVFGSTEDIFRTRIAEKNPKCVVMELAHHVTLSAPFRVVSSAAWELIGGPDAYMMTQGSIETTDFVDRHTVYSRLMVNQPDGSTVHSNIIRKRYVEEDREVIVARSVLEDALVPHMSKGAVDNKCLWFEVEPLPSHPSTHCSLTCVVQTTIDSANVSNLSAIDVEAVMETLTLQASLIANTHKPKAGMFHIMTQHVEPLGVPNPIHFSLDRGRMFLITLEDAVNRVVRRGNNLFLPS